MQNRFCLRQPLFALFIYSINLFLLIEYSYDLPIPPNTFTNNGSNTNTCNTSIFI